MKGKSVKTLKKVLPGDLEGGRYHKKEDAVMRLDDSVFIYENVPVFGKMSGEFQDSIQIHSMLKKDSAGKWIKYNDPKISFTNLDPGFFEWEETLVHISRIPARKQKQGMNTSNVVGKLYKVSTGKFVAYGVSWACLGSTACGKAMLGDYPSVHASFDRHRQTMKPVAVSNRIALVDFDVYFDLNKIGTVPKTVSSPYISLKYSYMDSVLAMHLAELGIDTNV